MKQEKNSLRAAKRFSRSPEKPRQIETTMTLKGDQYLLIQPKTVRKYAADEFDVDHIKIVGDQQATGRFKSGKSVPRARPTMFWEAREQDFKFNLEKRLQDRQDQKIRHQKKLGFISLKHEEVQSEIDLIN